MKYDVRSYLDNLGIDFREHGQNVMKDHIAIECPVCGADPSYHCNIRYDGNHMKCFICNYRTLNPIKIIEHITGEDVDYNIIKNIMEEFPIDVSYEKEIKEEVANPVRKIRFDILWNNFKILNKLHRHYLSDRYINEQFYTKWGFKTGTNYGKLKYSNRIIIPIRDLEGNIVNFTGRSVFKKPFLRYKNCVSNRAIITAGSCLYGLYESKYVKNRSVLFILEGIFDAIRILQVGNPAVALMKKDISMGQMELITDNFDEDTYIIIGLDKDATEKDVSKLVRKFGEPFKNIAVLKLKKAKDLGESPEKVVEQICRKSVINRRKIVNLEPSFNDKKWSLERH